jgi:nucleoside-diphosphate-sugar epimerase
VRALVRPGSQSKTLDDKPVEIALADLAGNAAPLDEALRGIDVVYHLAAEYRREDVPRSVFWQVNVEGTRRLLEAASRHEVDHFVHCSTVGVQGEIKDPPATEEHPYSPGDHYQESKRDGELLARKFFRDKELAGTVVRPVGIYGPGDMRFLKLFKHISHGRFRMIGDGRVLYHLTFVEDLVSGIALAGTSPAAIGEVFTIGGEEATTLNELAASIAGIYGRKIPRVHIPARPVWLAGLMCELICKPLRLAPPIYRRRVDFFMKDRAFDISKARRLLGYSPTVSLTEGLTRTARWYYQTGLIDIPPKGG